MDRIDLVGIIMMVVVGGWSIRHAEGIERTMAWSGLLFISAMALFFPHESAAFAILGLGVGADVGYCYARTDLKRQLESKVNELLVEFEGVPHAPSYSGLDADEAAELKRKIELLKEM